MRYHIKLKNSAKKLCASNPFEITKMISAGKMILFLLIHKNTLVIHLY